MRAENRYTLFLIPLQSRPSMALIRFTFQDVDARYRARHGDSLEPHPTLTVAGTRGSGAPMVLEKEMLRKNETDALEMGAASRENE
jgi:hypothetical protein